MASGSTLSEKPEPSGAAVSAAAQQQGSLALSATVINFGSVLDGTITQVQTIEVQNNGAVPVTLQSLIISGDFAIPASNCQLYEGASGFSGGVTLTPQEVCWIDVVMSPTKNGTETGQILITDTSLSGSHSVALTGLGIAQSQTLSFSPQTITFASQPLLVESGVQTFTVCNTGNEPVTIDSAVATGDFEVEGPGSSIYSNFGNQTAGTAGQPVAVYLSNRSPASVSTGINSIALTGANPADFQLTQNCGTALAGRQSCVINVAFAPQSGASGSRTAMVVITTAAGQTLAINVAGSAR